MVLLNDKNNSQQKSQMEKTAQNWTTSDKNMIEKGQEWKWKWNQKRPATKITGLAIRGHGLCRDRNAVERPDSLAYDAVERHDSLRPHDRNGAERCDGLLGGYNAAESPGSLVCRGRSAGAVERCDSLLRRGRNGVERRDGLLRRLFGYRSERTCLVSTAHHDLLRTPRTGNVRQMASYLCRLKWYLHNKCNSKIDRWPYFSVDKRLEDFTAMF